MHACVREDITTIHDYDIIMHVLHKKKLTLGLSTSWIYSYTHMHAKQEQVVKTFPLYLTNYHYDNKQKVKYVFL